MDDKKDDTLNDEVSQQLASDSETGEPDMKFIGSIRSFTNDRIYIHII